MAEFGLGGGPMAGYYVPELDQLQWPWSTPAAAAAPAAAVTPTPDPASATSPPNPGGSAPAVSAPASAPPPSGAAGPFALQPGIGIPLTALDALPPPPMLGPQPQPQLEGAPAPAPAARPELDGGAPEGSPPYAPIVLPDDALRIPPPPTALAAPAVPPSPATEPAVFGPPLSPEEQHYALTAKQYASTPFAIPDDKEQQRYLNELALRDPAGFSQLNIEHELAREKAASAERLAIINRDYDHQLANLKARTEADRITQQKSDALLADATRLAATKIDPSGGLSKGQKVAGILAAFVGGLVQGRTGSATNAGLEALNMAINRGIEAQKADLANQREGLNLRRGALAEEYARHGNVYQAEETARLATLQYADNLLSIHQQDYDPRGTTALKIASLRQGIAAQQQQALQAFKQKTYENELKLQDARRQQQLADETAWHNRAQIGLGYAQLQSADADRRAARDARRDEKDARREEKLAELADKEAERDRQFSIGGVPHLVLDADGKPVGGGDGPAVSYDPLRNVDGKIWRAASPEEHKELREKKTAATQLILLYDRALALRDKVGGESGAFNTAEYQELKGIEKEILLLKKAGTQGMSSDKDMDNLVAAAGADDLTSFRSRAPGIEAARERTITKLNQDFRDANYTGPAFRFPRAMPTTNTPEEDRAVQLLEKPSGGFARELADALAERRRGLSPDEARAFGPPISEDDIRRAGFRVGIDPRTGLNTPSIGIPLTPAQRGVFLDVATNFDPDVSAEQRNDVAQLAAVAGGDTKQAATARARLQNYVDHASSMALRDLARRALSEAAFASLPGTPESPSVRVR